MSQQSTSRARRIQAEQNIPYAAANKMADAIESAAQSQVMSHHRDRDILYPVSERDLLLLDALGPTWTLVIHDGPDGEAIRWIEGPVVITHQDDPHGAPEVITFCISGIPADDPFPKSITGGDTMSLYVMWEMALGDGYHISTSMRTDEMVAEIHGRIRRYLSNKQNGRGLDWSLIDYLGHDHA